MAIEPERQCILEIAPHPQPGVFRNPAHAFNSLWANAHD